MAVIVLCSIAAGAIVTLVRGPWMWGSLLILPAAAGLAILLLYRLNDSLLRRSLQLAILASFALHLLVLIVTSLTVIFGNSLPAEKVVVAKRPERKKEKQPLLVNNILLDRAGDTLRRISRFQDFKICFDEAHTCMTQPEQNSPSHMKTKNTDVNFCTGYSYRTEQICIERGRFNTPCQEDRGYIRFFI